MTTDDDRMVVLLILAACAMIANQEASVSRYFDIAEAFMAEAEKRYGAFE